MEHGVQGEAKWPIDLEATVAKSVRRLRVSRGLSQQQLGSDLFVHGFAMHQTTVAKLEAGSKPLRLNEVAAIAAYFDVPMESLWEPTAVILNEHEGAVLGAQIEAFQIKLVQAAAEVDASKTHLAEVSETSERARNLYYEAVSREDDLERRLTALTQRQRAVQTALGIAPIESNEPPAQPRQTRSTRIKRTTPSRAIRRREAG